MKAIEPHQLPGPACGERRGIEVLRGAGLLDGGAQFAAPPAVPLLGMAFPGEGQRTSAQQQDGDSRSAPQTRNKDAGKGTETEERDVLVARARSGRKARDGWGAKRQFRPASWMPPHGFGVESRLRRWRMADQPPRLTSNVAPAGPSDKTGLQELR
jgi:hypothetical protein